jgi:DNA helicase HerA-like ATPase
MDNSIGIVVGGSLNGGLVAKLDSSFSVEDINVGRYVTIEGSQKRFMGMVTDVSLQVSDPQIALTPPNADDTFSSRILSGIGAYGQVSITPYLIISDKQNELTEPESVKTIPSHFSKVSLSSDAEFQFVFGKEDEEQNFVIGNPLDMEYKLCLDIPKFVERSNGVFGKSGTGKTFFTRMLLGAMIQKSKAVNLVFDMHSEYGHAGTSEEKGQVKGLKQFFPDVVTTFVLEGGSTTTNVDGVIKIDLEDIEPEDLSILRNTLNLTDAAIDATYAFKRRFGRIWFKKLIDQNDIASDKDDGTEHGIRDILAELHIHDATFDNLMRGLNRIYRMQYVNKTEAKTDAVNSIMSRLLGNKNVIIEFGRYNDLLTYMLVSNLLARRIYKEYQQRTEDAINNKTAKPTPLVITIEEAHNFLDESLAQNSIFGIIAREMRKYNVTLLVIDQRPSGIQEEILSQMGTKVTFLMDNDKDIDAVLAGTSGKSALRGVLAKLASKQQALIFGHAVPMPISFKPRTYDDKIFTSEDAYTTDNTDDIFAD